MVSSLVVLVLWTLQGKDSMNKPQALGVDLQGWITAWVKVTLSSFTKDEFLWGPLQTRNTKALIYSLVLSSYPRSSRWLCTEQILKPRGAFLKQLHNSISFKESALWWCSWERLYTTSPYGPPGVPHGPVSLEECCILTIIGGVPEIFFQIGLAEGQNWCLSRSENHHATKSLLSSF
jgi:hypothetical protein